MPPGVKRSRVLWDEARKEDARWTATARAILYELQPIRFSTFDISGIVSTVSRIARFVVALTCSIVRSLPDLARGLVRMLRGMSRRQWGVLGMVVGYYYFVRLVHRYLEAGPFVVIATGMIGIFTIGLGDGDSAGMSAYSVFNRGFQQLLGSVDVEALVQQYAGGGLAVQAQMNANNRDEGTDARAGRQRGNNHAAAQPPPAAAAAAAAGANENEEADDDDNDDTPQDGRNRARRSNKKSRNKDRRERNANVRREMEQQRQAAAAMGFVGEGEQDDAAMNRLVEEQVLAEQHQHEDD